jgi:hypothetical protein
MEDNYDAYVKQFNEKLYYILKYVHGFDFPMVKKYLGKDIKRLQYTKKTV